MAKQKTERQIDLIDPDGKPYTTTSPVEAVNLRARGYRTAPAKKSTRNTTAPATGKNATNS